MSVPCYGRGGSAGCIVWLCAMGVSCTGAWVVGCTSDPLAIPSFSLDVTLSSEIPTVASVTWRGRTRDLLAADVEFGLEGTGGAHAPVEVVDVGELRATLVGMKPDADYGVRATMRYDGWEAVSDLHPVSTGSAPPELCGLTLDTSEPARMEPGFLVTANMPGIPEILDADGDRVWWRDGGHADEGIVTRVRLSHDHASVVYLTRVSTFERDSVGRKRA